MQQQYQPRQQEQANGRLMSGSTDQVGGPGTGGANEEDMIIQHILELTSPVTREQALLELSKKREAYENLGIFSVLSNPLFRSCLLHSV